MPLPLQSPMAKTHGHHGKLKNSKLEKSSFPRHFNVIWAVQSPIVKMFGFSAVPNQWLFSRRPAPPTAAPCSSESQHCHRPQSPVSLR
jgi:hypothetical protein